MNDVKKFYNLDISIVIKNKILKYFEPSWSIPIQISLPFPFCLAENPEKPWKSLHVYSWQMLHNGQPLHWMVCRTKRSRSVGESMPLLKQTSSPFLANSTSCSSEADWVSFSSPNSPWPSMIYAIKLWSLITGWTIFIPAWNLILGKELVYWFRLRPD